jgi:hypothetical protein
LSIRRYRIPFILYNNSYLTTYHCLQLMFNSY